MRKFPGMGAHLRHCEERSDEATQLSWCGEAGLLRCACNDDGVVALRSPDGAERNPGKLNHLRRKSRISLHSIRTTTPIRHGRLTRPSTSCFRSGQESKKVVDARDKPGHDGNVGL